MTKPIPRRPIATPARVIINIVDCPTCGANPKAVCVVGQSRNMDGFHQRRIDKATGYAEARQAIIHKVMEAMTS